MSAARGGRSSRLLSLLAMLPAAGLAALLAALPTRAPAGTDDAAEAALGENPYLGQKDAIDDGEKLYRSRCFGCHFRAGGRGPNLFRTKLSEAQFVDTVTNGGRSGMPAWGSSLSRDEIRKLYAFVMSRDRL